MDASPSYCTYAFGTNTTVGRERMHRMRLHMAQMNHPYVAVDALGPVTPFVPCLRGRHGYVGMWRSMLHIWRMAQRTCVHEWVLILESDARLPRTFARVAGRAMHNATRIVWFDARAGIGLGPSGCCTNVMAYHRSVLDTLIYNFDPSNRRAFWNRYAHRSMHVVRDPVCLTDWYLANLVAVRHIPASRYGIVRHSLDERSELGSVHMRWNDRKRRHSTRTAPHTGAHRA